VIGLFPSPSNSRRTFQLNAREGNHKSFLFKTRIQNFGSNCSAFAHKLEIYDSKRNLIGGVSKNNITLGQLKFPMGGGAIMSSTSSSFTFEKEKYQMSIENGAISLKRNRDAAVLAKYHNLSYNGSKLGFGNILISPEAFTSDLYLAITAFFVWQLHARVPSSKLAVWGKGSYIPYLLILE
jgi:hypothetical protein